MSTKWLLRHILFTIAILMVMHGTKGIINRRPIAKDKHLRGDNTHGKSHLNAKRPLWILKDERAKATLRQRIPPTPPMHFRRKAGDHHMGSFFKRKPLQQQPQQQRQNHRRLHFLPQPMPIKQPNEPRQMPTFATTPGGEDGPAIAEHMPSIFIYNGPKGELIFNTMLRAARYPMQEPVPGDTLFPPSTPMFRPRPIVERFRVANSNEEQTMNLTLIPFYAHEAIATPPQNVGANHAPTPSTTPLPPTVLYAMQKPPALRDHTTTTEMPRRRGRKRYNAFHSAKEVHWQPPRVLAARTTTPFPLTLASPLQNHRHLLSTTATATTTTTQQPMRNFQLTYKDEDESFQIVYMDETDGVEKTDQITSSSAIQPLIPMSSKYTLPKEYYAFPVFTLGKLLKPERTMKTLKLPEAPTPDKPNASTDFAEVHSVHAVNNDSLPADDDDAEDTWFILNSRYKGALSGNENYRLSSKYVQKSRGPTLKPSAVDATA